jgi:hypothetical protein
MRVVFSYSFKMALTKLSNMIISSWCSYCYRDTPKEAPLEVRCQKYDERMTAGRIFHALICYILTRLRTKFAICFGNTRMEFGRGNKEIKQNLEVRTLFT